jgi:hypothetical protein
MPSSHFLLSSHVLTSDCHFLWDPLRGICSAHLVFVHLYALITFSERRRKLYHFAIVIFFLLWPILRNLFSNLLYVLLIGQGLGKGKVVPVPDWLSTAPWRCIGEWMYRSTFFTSTLALSDQLHVPAALPPGKSSRYPLNRMFRSGWRGEKKILDPTGTRTLIPLSSSRYLVAITTALSQVHGGI